MARWLRYLHDGASGFGRLDGETIQVHAGDLFADPTPTGATLSLSEVTVDLPCRPSKYIALWNNFHASAEKQGLTRPDVPLYFVKPASCYLASGQTITAPEGVGRLLFEGELGIVIGRRGRDLTPETAAAHIFGYTCVNDVTALETLKADPSFVHWTRSKGFDGFGPFGPVIATDIEPEVLDVAVRVNGRERQRYPLADMMRRPAELVAELSRDMTLEPGDLIACGTSVGSGPIPRGATVEVEIAGIGVLSNGVS
jgi:2-keto-4-pentenoate hydratase/2-oxohepta-3-ene-1,7-dioic acid hydratase in catechol pathway